MLQWITFYFYSLLGSDAETEDDDGFTPINTASENGHLEVVKYLYETCYADVETKDNEGNIFAESSIHVCIISVYEAISVATLIELIKHKQINKRVNMLNKSSHLAMWSFTSKSYWLFDVSQ